MEGVQVRENGMNGWMDGWIWFRLGSVCGRLGEGCRRAGSIKSKKPKIIWMHMSDPKDGRSRGVFIRRARKRATIS